MTPRKTTEQIAQLAIDMQAGKVFTDRQVRNKSDMPIVFMPLLFADQDMLDDMKDVGIVYEYMDKAGPRSLNGMPIFMSFKMLHKDDLQILQDKYNLVEESHMKIVRG